MSPPSPLIVLYDGECPFCCRVVAWCARRSRAEVLFFGKNTGQSARVLGEPPGGDLGTIVVWEGSKRWVRSTAALKILYAVGGIWRGLSVIGTMVPQFIRDGVYNFIARRRHLLAVEPMRERLSSIDSTD